MPKEKSRAFGPDLVRAAAAVLVLSVHFFLNSGYYNQPLQGKGMFLSTVIRMACMTCVPLFMMLTGYLCSKISWSLGYYRRLIRVVLSYTLAGGACVVFRLLWMRESISGEDILRQFLNYAAAPYGWYIEMYIGLFLLIPFFNAAWHGLSGEGRRALVWTLLAITVLPVTINVTSYKLAPAWWSGFYPLAYYALGAWLRERPLKVGGRWLLLGWIALSVGNAGIQWFASKGGNFLPNQATYWSGALVMGETVCVFSLLIRCEGTGWPVPLRRFVSWLARVSLELYLLSYIGDRLLYPHLLNAGLTPGRRLLWLPVIVVINVLFSGVLAQLVHWAIAGIMKLLPTGKKEPAQETKES